MKGTHETRIQTSAARFSIALCGALLLLVQASPQAAKPSPELKKQDFFVGTWTLQGITISSRFGPGGQKFKSTEHLEWMPGGFFLLVHSYSGEKLAGVTVIGYDSKEKVFTHTSFNSTGQTELWRGTAEDDKWTWTREETIDAKRINDRLAIRKTSPSSYSFTVEMKPVEGDNWSLVAEGTGTRSE